MAKASSSPFDTVVSLPSKPSGSEKDDLVSLTARPASIISLQNLRKTYDLGEVRVEALKGISLEIPSGQFVAIMGAPDQENPRCSTSWDVWTVLRMGSIC